MVADLEATVAKVMRDLRLRRCPRLAQLVLLTPSFLRPPVEEVVAAAAPDPSRAAREGLTVVALVEVAAAAVRQIHHLRHRPESALLLEPSSWLRLNEVEVAAAAPDHSHRCPRAVRLLLALSFWRRPAEVAAAEPGPSRVARAGMPVVVSVAVAAVARQTRHRRRRLQSARLPAPPSWRQRGEVVVAAGTMRYPSSLRPRQLAARRWLS
jgi:hypothetical protein